MKSKMVRYARRKRRVRKNVSGTGERPRLSVFRSSEHIYAQIINDVEARTLVSASTTDPEVKSQITNGMSKSDKSKIVGVVLAQRAKAANVSSVSFDRNGFLYHGRVRVLAEAARENGLEF
ncbi:MAG: 50S ribosomal protein L18 [Ignavibacteria bacterium]|nr:50S ribosomal protein L18 [Ignavibacteria bacterium]